MGARLEDDLKDEKIHKSAFDGHYSAFVGVVGVGLLRMRRHFRSTVGKSCPTP